jgi:hypothetical protein
MASEAKACSGQDLSQAMTCMTQHWLLSDGPMTVALHVHVHLHLYILLCAAYSTYDWHGDVAGR